ncbi:MAG: arsenosugar biosynthesis radical SAM protein ArsS [Nitrospira sp.]|nr:arsenosugar biosynthesis radical SAM protein ArsS [Nitrospira sp.]MDH4371516.1 arsenosugar biosynthesis radical SAM protein ArsS [Nitrospira sp.]MDH5347265.1 arsenosugar biosynthesis radical SAM protein ArsS [Nitrospira sp.]MDH5497844.1 arsenosugar biosynthesis radical SAM protein ArsS [Nitrospira sp.]MDH5726512.1 arsenosugar biosynthesis radical SAM protein ArsS [Nitrospira sp.]
MALTLLGRSNPLASSAAQLRLLDQSIVSPPFNLSLTQAGLFPLHATGLAILQINVGKLCNQTCRHCHVDAGPDRIEIMSRETAEQCVTALAKTDIPTIDITGGAPELNPNFRWLVEQARELGRHVVDRCNLSVLLLPSQADLAEFLASQRVEIIASLPSYRAGQTDTQRGDGIFEKSIEALRLLNRFGYGRPDSELVLNLVYNPVGAFLPPKQEALEAQFKKELRARHGIEFNRLYTITNMPISRFLEFLMESGNYDQYMTRLANAFNPAAAAGVMCRYTLSVGWDGKLYDCDFNQMLDLPVNHGTPSHIREFDPMQFHHRQIVTRNHCYGCTAGSGSSCSGATS